MVPVPQRTQERRTGWSTWWLRLVLVLGLVATACGGVSDLVDDQLASQLEAESSDDGSAGFGSGSSDSDGGSDSADPGDPAAFRLGRGAWENGCTVLTTDDVATATGFDVLEAREGIGCSWVIAEVDPDIISEPMIGFEPMTTRQYDVQQEIAMTGSGGIVAEPIEGLGSQAFWRGQESSGHGEVWVQTDQIGFRITNLFASPGFTGDTRTPMEALAAAVVDALSTMDVIAASGDAGDALTPPDSVELPEGIPTESSLIEELSAVPLPDGVVIGSGAVYPDRASQDAYSELGVGDAARFFLEALPAAGFEITSNGTIETEEDVLEFASQSISFLDPDGNRGDIQIREGAFSPSQLNIQIFLP